MKKPPKGKYIWTVRVGDKGQIVIPKEARDVFSISPGDTLVMLGDVNRGIAIARGEDMWQFSDALMGRLSPEGGEEE